MNASRWRGAHGPLSTTWKELEENPIEGLVHSAEGGVA